MPIHLVSDRLNFLKLPKQEFFMKFSIFILSSLSVISTVCANENHCDHNLSQILDHAQTAIDKIDGHKVFLKPEKIYLYEGSILLESDHGEAIKLPHIYSNQLGLYLDDSTFANRVKTWICTHCTKAYPYDPIRCERCHKSDFIIRYLP